MFHIAMTKTSFETKKAETKIRSVFLSGFFCQVRVSVFEIMFLLDFVSSFCNYGTVAIYREETN